MYGLTATKWLSERGGRKFGLATPAFAALVLLSALSAPALSQTVGRPKYDDFKTTIGMAAGQTVRILIEAADSSGASLNQTGNGGARVRVFDGLTGMLIREYELAPAAGLRSVDISRDAIGLTGEPVTGRLQLWLEVRLVSTSFEGEAEDPAAVVPPPTFEVIDASGRTTVRGEMVKVGSGTVVYTGLEQSARLMSSGRPGSRPLVPHRRRSSSQTSLSDS